MLGHLRTLGKLVGPSVGGRRGQRGGSGEKSGDAENVGLMGRVLGSFWAQWEGLGGRRADSTTTGSWVRGAALATGRRKGEAGGGRRQLL